MLVKGKKKFFGPSSQIMAAASLGPAAAFLARTSGLDGTHTTAYTNLINGLVSDGVWGKLDVLHIYATQDSTTALLNLVSTNYNGVANGSPTFTVDRGFTGGVSGGGTVYINTTFNPSSASSPQYTLNSGHLSGWVLNDIQETRNFIGATAAGIFAKFTDNNAYFTINAATNINVAVASAIGHYIANRSASNAVQGYKNGSSIISGSVASTGVPNLQYFVLSDNNGAPLGASNQVAMASIGASLSATDVTNFYNRLRTYMTAVGVP
jgi:hypothetical protein